MSDAAQQEPEVTCDQDFSFTIMVNGTEIHADTSAIETLTMTPDGEYRTELAGELARWFAILAEAECEAARVDAHYRAWSAEAYCAYLAKDAKLAEWKVKRSVEDHPSFRAFKEAQAKAQRNIILVRGMVEALQVLAGRSPNAPVV